MISRRTVLKTGAAAVAVAGVGWDGGVQAEVLSPKPAAWRSFEIRTRVEPVSSKGPVRAWVPVPSVAADDRARPGETWFTGDADSADLEHRPVGMVRAEWKSGAPAPVLEVTSAVAIRGSRVALERGSAKLSAVDRARYVAATARAPTDGIVKATADTIVGRLSGDFEKARAIHDWLAANTFRDAKVRGRGAGDVERMLESGELGGEWADIAALYVGLARAAGLPSRTVCGLWFAPAGFGDRSLGADWKTITRAQLCRAEVWLDGVGWAPVDPPNVRDVAPEEPPTELSTTDMTVTAGPFGSWEGDWIAYNEARDVKLPGSGAPALGLFMHPQTETVAGLMDCLDPNGFKYVITAREVAA